MMSASITSTSKDDPMQIDQTWFKPFMEQEKQWRCVDKQCMHYGEPSHIATNYPKKQLSHTTQATFIHTPPIEDSKNEDV